jgi:hypothetical protein
VIRRIADVLRAPPVFVNETVDVLTPVLSDVLTSSAYFGPGLITAVVLFLTAFVHITVVSTFQTAVPFRPIYSTVPLKTKIK